jgi:hypothetical protein
METSATSLRFGEESVGEMGTPALLTVSNSGFSALNIADVQAAGAHDTDFEVLGNCRGSSIPQGQSCDAVVVFVPSALGMRTGSLQLTSNDPTSPIRSISLSGTGAANVSGYAHRCGSRGRQQVRVAIVRASYRRWQPGPFLCGEMPARGNHGDGGRVTHRHHGPFQWLDILLRGQGSERSWRGRVL